MVDRLFLDRVLSTGRNALPATPDVNPASVTQSCVECPFTSTAGESLTDDGTSLQHPLRLHACTSTLASYHIWWGIYP